MLLRDLVPSNSIPPWAANLPIEGLASDSRQIKKGFLFAALPGEKFDGRSFIHEAKARGAVAILTDPATSVPSGIAVIKDSNPRRALALLAARYYARQPAVQVAITGTNGKTSTVDFLRQLWTLLGYSAASVGTLGVLGGKQPVTGSMTTPDPISLHRLLADLVDQGIDHLALEASSHGLDQYRLDGLRLWGAGFTNLTRDHLDYHRTMAHYRAAKARLFTALLPEDGVAVLNADSPEYAYYADICAARGIAVCSYGYRGSDVRLLRQTPDEGGQRLTLELRGTRHQFQFPMAGLFQAHNLLCAMGLLLAQGIDRHELLKAAAQLKGIKGRIECVAHHPEGGAIYVDYAHTPDALKTILSALRPHTRGRLIVVFGCGGDRDPGKRKQMGMIANELADRILVTDDNPRSEEPAAIRRAILAGCPRGEDAGDRRSAIITAISEMLPDDLVVIAGKGHESGQTIGDITYPFDDGEIARETVRGVAA